MQASLFLYTYLNKDDIHLNKYDIYLNKHRTHLNIPNMKSPLITFIIPVYNLPLTLIKECLDSIMALSLQSEEREIIIVDDGSDYSPINELSEYADEVIFVRQKNGGLSAARNMGLRMATGKYIQFVDGDDCLIPASYEQCLDVARFKNPDMVMFDFTHNPDEESDILPVSEHVTGTEYMLKNNIHATAWGYIFRKDVLMNLRFTTGLLHEDEEFTPQLIIRCERIFCLKVKAYYYRERTGSITQNKGMEWKERRINDLHSIILKLNKIADTLPSTDRQAMQRRVAQLTMDYIYNVIVLIHKRNVLKDLLEQLKQEGLFPLPDRKYTTKYQLFRKMTNSKIGLEILFNTLPILKK